MWIASAVSQASWSGSQRALERPPRSTVRAGVGDELAAHPWIPPLGNGRSLHKDHQFLGPLWAPSSKIGNHNSAAHLLAALIIHHRAADTSFAPRSVRIIPGAAADACPVGAPILRDGAIIVSGRLRRSDL